MLRRGIAVTLFVHRGREFVHYLFGCGTAVAFLGHLGRDRGWWVPVDTHSTPVLFGGSCGWPSQ